MDFGLLLLRLVVGLTLAAHGAQKLFGWFGGPGIEGTARGMESLGFVPGKRAAVMAGLAETVAGMLLAAGATTPFAAAVLVGVMLVAIVSVHLEHGFFVTGGGYEYPLVLAVSAATLAFTGPGRLSVDAWFGIHSAGMLWGTGALLVGIFGATVQLASRGRTATAHTRA